MKQGFTRALPLAISLAVSSNSHLLASQIPTGQDIGATVRVEKTEKEQKAMIKRLTRKKKKVEIEGEEAIQPKGPSKNL